MKTSSQFNIYQGAKFSTEHPLALYHDVTLGIALYKIRLANILLPLPLLPTAYLEPGMSVSYRLCKEISAVTSKHFNAYIQ